MRRSTAARPRPATVAWKLLIAMLGFTRAAVVSGMSGLIVWSVLGPAAGGLTALAMSFTFGRFSVRR